MQVKEIVQQTETKMKKSIESARREFNEVRTGRAHPGLIEGLHAMYYGKPTMFKELANVSIPDPKTIVIQPWDVTVIPEIEKAVMNSNVGASVSNDGKFVRLSIPQLSEERRKEMTKVVKDMAEKSRISLRTIRRDANDLLKKLRSEKAISEDDEFKAHEMIQTITDKFIKEIDQMMEEKNKILTSLN